MVDLSSEPARLAICPFSTETKGSVLMNESMSKDHVCYNSMKVG